MKAPYAQVDAFAGEPFTGNPAAVVLLESWPDEALMRAFAAETRLPATAFLVPDRSEAADYGLRWFSPTQEMRMCGHGTLAAAHILLSADRALGRVRLATRHAGVLSVSREAEGYALDLPAKFARREPLPMILAALGPRPAVVDTLWHDEQYAVVVLEDEESVRAVRPDFRLLGALGNYQTIVTAPGVSTDIVTRAFAPASGIDEDAATGSAHAVIVPYWAAELGRTHLSALQASPRTARMACRMAGDRVILTCRCVTVIEGFVSL